MHGLSLSCFELSILIPLITPQILIIHSRFNTVLLFEINLRLVDRL